MYQSHYDTMYVLNAEYMTSGKPKMIDVDEINNTIVECLFFVLSWLFEPDIDMFKKRRDLLIP